MIITPPNQWYSENDKLLFLAGPIKGSDNWQTKVIDIIHKTSPEIIIANPFVKDVEIEEALRVSWDLYHIRLASAIGIVVFWITKDCHDEKIIFQLGEWLQNLKYRRKYQPERPLKIVIGIEPGFSIEKYILFRIADELPDLPIFSTIEDVCGEILNLSRLED